MKILHIINRLGGGGAEKLISETIPIINKNENITADVLLIDDSKVNFLKKLTDNEVNVQVVPLKNLYNPCNIYYR